MIKWNDVLDSTRIAAEAYLAEDETILVRFPDGVEWAYYGCPPEIWAEFTAPGQSRGKFISNVLNHKHHGRWHG